MRTLDPAKLYPYTQGMVNIGAAKKDIPEGRRFTYADYKNWELAQGERYELISGEACAMSAPSAYHQLILGELFRQFANYLTGKSCKVYPAPYEVRLFYQEDEQDDTVVQPDIAIVCDKNKRGKEGCRGAPDFVAEILSPANTAGEIRRKFNLYREAGVREYWELDPESKTLHTHYFKDSTILSHFYRSSDTVKPAIFQDLEIALEPVFAE
jgi:Uma2 family endonuclease